MAVSTLQHQYNVADPGLIGLAITYALSGLLNSFKRIAMERVKQYLDNVPTKSATGDNPSYHVAQSGYR